MRAFIAHSMMCETATHTDFVGSIRLYPHQKSAVARLHRAIDEFGGALLADEVGMGKTFVALALCAGRHARVVAPAVLRDMWMSAAESANATIEFTSTESLSRIDPKSPSRSERAALIIIDEAHHFRNPATKRYAALARLTSSAPILLLTATPVHNKRNDLLALLSLFRGSSAGHLTQAELSRLIVRRAQKSLTSASRFPGIANPVWCDLNHDDVVPGMILNLPPPLPPSDGGDGGVLIINSLLRQWASSDRALERTVVRRLQRSMSLINALENGTYPSSSELSAWVSTEDCVQLAFAELVATPNSSADQLLPVVRRHADGLSALLQHIRSNPSADVERAELVRTIRRTHEGVSIVAFSQYADTVEGLFRLLAPDGEVAMLTGGGARVHGGAISRAGAISRFAPQASRAVRPPQSERVSLLLATDILSEGVNLQDAGVVIHLDLPWTPARMEQRLGRVARMGSQHESVSSYLIRPPASAETLIRLEAVLREKIASSGFVVDEFPSLGLYDESRFANTPKVTEAIRSILAGWLAGPPQHADGEMMVASVLASAQGFLALCRIDGQLRLVTSSGSAPSDDPVRIISALLLCSGRAANVDADAQAAALSRIRRHFSAAAAVARDSSSPAKFKRSALKRIARIVAQSRPHERTHMATLSANARSVLTSHIGAGIEREIEQVTRLMIPDEQWLAKVAAFNTCTSAEVDPTDVLALILLQSEPDTKT